MFSKIQAESETEGQGHVSYKLCGVPYKVYLLEALFVGGIGYGEPAVAILKALLMVLVVEAAHGKSADLKACLKP